ncbi:hypothetical protein IMSAG249_02407 [Lachnospiraceae bacterium]|nr:hypothetical protein IMSAG249_02407 [Lachnospiraceae bacterium]
MAGLSGSEQLFYGGIALMVIAVIVSGICTIIFKIMGKKIRHKLEQEYGKLDR